MTASRAPRPTRRSPRHDQVPAAATRRRRGPAPPDDAIADLETAWDAIPEDTPPEARRNLLLAALLLAWVMVERHARRGVARALPEPWAGTVRLAPGLSAAPALEPVPETRAALGNRLRAWHAAAVQHFAATVGSTEYIWTTHPEHSKSGTRELHRELEGTRHSWTNPPVSGTNGFRGHPQEPAECVCTAFPLPPVG
ncbi:MAG TPA: hypothetical protein VF092_28155 [Longimicrobium sp.]